jgi:hypothetical protein
MMPSVAHDTTGVQVDIKCKEPSAGVAESVRVVLLNPSSSLPMLSAVVRMPISEIEDGDS